MKSIKELYRIGTGPSSSHTMGPRKAAEIFLERHPEATAFKVTLYGSLAATGKGHMTNIAITEVLQPVAPVEIIWEPKIFLPFPPERNEVRFGRQRGKRNRPMGSVQHRRRRFGGRERRSVLG